ncbi:SLC13 family permease [Hyalangium gracile]|uniref:SLC13 family permease n=1 Tax=Hyalangium gracile TaxID=394092 RepID=UPI001CC9DD09|nr:DASS family sodium-coupled anion symporter [Hyalangium gracile]
MLDTRASIQALLGHFEFSSGRALVKISMSLLVAGLVAYLPAYADLSSPGRHALFILLVAAGLWLTEAMAAFAVALVVIALEILLLGRLGRGAGQEEAWLMFLRPWASPIIWLFLGGFALARAASRTGLDRAMAERVLDWSRGHPGRTLVGTMALTFTLSMFMSNTATTAMMLATVGPLVAGAQHGTPFARALLLGIPVSANLGGMGTLIGSPPNAIAAAALEVSRPLSFSTWMVAALPPALLLIGAVWLLLRRLHPHDTGKVELAPAAPHPEHPVRLPRWKAWLVVGVFFLTVGLWMTGELHGIPLPVVSFLPVTLFAAAGVLEDRDVRGFQWDVLLLVAGGLSLGVAVSETGLARWLVGFVPVDTLGRLTLALMLAYLASILSNFMSNTAAANILVPLGAALGGEVDPSVVVPIALSASAAMCLPISTPPNALVFATGQVPARAFLRPGLLVGLLAPPLAVLWASVVL